jgi:hypothetical protein
MRMTDMKVPVIVDAMMQDLSLFRVTHYIDKSVVVKLTRRIKARKNSTRQEFVLTIGAPNYLERKFIVACIKAKEPFPIKNLQLQHWPKKRKEQ